MLKVFIVILMKLKVIRNLGFYVEILMAIDVLLNNSVFSLKE